MTAIIGGPLGASLPRRGVIILLALVLACALLVGLSLATGSYGRTIAQVLGTLTGNPPEPMARTVVFEFRLPPVVVALFCGGMPALSGAVLKVLTRNGLADPSLLGVSQGAALPVVSLIVLMPEAPHSLRIPLAFLGAIVPTLLAQTSCLTMRQVASDLGIALSTLGKLVRAISEEAKVPAQDVGLLGENERLRKENRILKEEREVLEKATMFFAAQKPLGFNVLPSILAIWRAAICAA